MSDCLLCGNPLKDSRRFSDLLLLTRESGGACQECLQGFEAISEQRCPCCCRSGCAEVCSDCRRWEREGKTVRHESCFIYNQSMKDYFSRYKFEGDYLLRFVFGKKLVRKLRGRKGYSLVPIPVSQKKFQKRGFNQVAGLLEAAGLPYQNLLEKEDTAAQSSKTREERLQSSQCFRIRKNIPLPEKMILVDDIYTTGATLQLAKEVLLEAGVKEILTFSIAR